MNQPSAKRLLTAAEVRNALGISRVTLWKWGAERGFPRCKIGKMVRYPADKVEAWLQKHALGDLNLPSGAGSLAAPVAASPATETVPQKPTAIIQDERTVKHMLEEQTALLREIRDLFKAKRTLTMTLAGQS